MVKILGIEFAPLFVPFERRLQTFAASFWISVFILSLYVPFVVLYIIFFTNYYWLMIIYLIWIFLFDAEVCEKGGRRSSWIRNWKLWDYFRDYFPIKLTTVGEFDSKKNYFLCSYPHGVLATGFYGSFSTNACGFHKLFPGFEIYPIVLNVLFKIPFFRELCLGFGGCSSSRNSLNYLLSKPGGGNFVAIVLGGAEEAFLCRPGEYKIVLKKRRGFIKIALENGSPLVPVFSFGETNVYNQVNNPPGSVLRAIQDFVKSKTGIAPVLPVGRGIFQYSFGVTPKRSRITTVVGKPIDVPKLDVPTEEQVDEYHRKFTEGLVELFETEKFNYVENPENAKLVIL